MKDHEIKSLHGNRRAPKRSICRSIFTSPLFYLTLALLAFFAGYYTATSTSSSSAAATTNTINFPSRLAATTAAMTLPPEIDNFRVAPNCIDPIPTDLIRETLLTRVYGGASPFDNFPPPHVANSLRDRKLKGWGSKGAVFRHLIEEVRPKIIIEVGTFLGASAVHMATLTRQLGLDDTLILCIDDFRGWPGFREQFQFINHINGDVMLLYQFMQNVVYSNVTDSVLPLPFSTGSTLSRLCQWGVTADLIEIDAGHEFNSAWSDINRAFRLLRPGGVMFGHDYFRMGDNRGVRRAVNLFAQIYGLRVQTDGEHWVIHTS
ncbi:unnamed protein product [Linum tenue]|uniref:S-adenosyl-L-methionine-dependent methyltransferase n=2 Tax=Linum tenue TaxID=586396 RepID=A0AAV0N615_9ROSI|nr:unnamed protein product [Linum tenue]CAI0454254.1 unnamed protein product [Linum tenue]